MSNRNVAFLCELAERASPTLTAITPAATAVGLELRPCSAADLSAAIQQSIARGDNVAVMLIGSHLTDPVAVARDAFALLPHAQIVFLTSSDRELELRRRLALAPRIGTNWSLSSPNGEVLIKTFEAAIKSTRQRLQHRTTLDRIRMTLAAPPPVDVPDYRRLVLADRHLGSILTHARDAIFSTDLRGVLHSWNRGAADLLLYPERDVLGRPVDILDTEGTDSRLLELVGAVVRGAPEVRREVFLRRADGSAIAVEITLAPVRDEQGVLLGVSVIARDVTDRLKAAAAVREQKALLQATLSSIGDAVITTDVDGRVATLNGVAESLTGWTTAEAQGVPLDQVFRIINEYTRHTVESPASRALREGVIVGLANHTLLIAKDGTERPIDDSAAPIRGLGNRIVGCVLVFRDITERKKAERQLLESERRRRLALDSAELGAWHIDLATMSLSTDERFRAIFGLTALDMSFEQAVTAIHPDDQQRVRDAVAAATRSEAPIPYAVEHRVIHPSGAVRWVFAKGRANYESDEAGSRLTSLDGTVADVTDRKYAEEQLRAVAAELSEADRRKTEFIATLGHELRNPLAPIRTGLELMKLQASDPTAWEETRSMMERQAQQMVRLIDDLLEVSRITQGKLQLRKARVDLSEVVRSAVEAARPFIDEAGHKLTVQLPPQRIFLDADPNRLAQVFSNLLNNATKYTPEGGHLRLEAELLEGEVMVTVKDNGIGIPAEMQVGIFEMFAQIDRPLEKGYKGLGIGLTLVKRLVELHDGRVEVRSGGDGQGSEFSVRLPILREALPMNPTQDQTAPARRSAGYRVLVVDDNKDAATMLSLMVKMLGNEVQTAHDGKQGVAAAEDFRPDMVLMDLGMPNMNGYEAARHIRNQAWGKAMRLVALTGWGQEEDRQRTKEAGFDHHLVKPAEPAALQQLLAGLEKPAAP